MIKLKKEAMFTWQGFTIIYMNETDGNPETTGLGRLETWGQIQRHLGKWEIQG